MKKIYYATSNPTKFQEGQQFFKTFLPTIELEQYGDDVPEIQTLNQEEIAVRKARKAWEHAQVPILAEDAGVYFTQYHEFPGTLTKFIYKAIGMDGIFKLVNNGDKAYFQLHLVYYYGKDQYKVFKGRTDGSIVKPEEFLAPESAPYDDIFVPEGDDKTYTDLRKEDGLEQFNFRVKAFNQFAEWYKNHPTK
jgi:XTP/dITP diphosphohydrolase